MRIFYDARWTRTDSHDGISRFGSNLLGALAELTDVTMLIHDKRQLGLLPTGVPHILVNHPLSPKELALPRMLNDLDADVVYSPMQIMGTLGRRYKLIFTLHDTIYYKYPLAPTYLPAPQRALWWLFHQAHWPGRMVLNQADVVATVSQTSKEEIRAIRLTDRPIAVVYNAPPQLKMPAQRGEVARELVFMGTLMPYKNAETIIRSLAHLPEYRLHLAGRGTPDRLDALRAVATENGVTDRVVFWNGADDEQYTALLSAATASVSASKAEGFGLPLIEAMSVGVPFVGTDMPIFREVAGDAALYFDADSPAELAQRVRELEDPETRARLIERGRRRAEAFTWHDSASRLYEVMRDLHAMSPAGVASSPRPSADGIPAAESERSGR